MPRCRRPIVTSKFRCCRHDSRGADRHGHSETAFEFSLKLLGAARIALPRHPLRLSKRRCITASALASNRRVRGPFHDLGDDDHAAAHVVPNPSLALLAGQAAALSGVAAFGYALLHTAFYLIDKGSLSKVLSEALELSIWTGWLAFLIFVPLAMTSNEWAVKTLKRAWKPLQRWVYAAAVLTLAHWIFLEYELGAALAHFLPLAGLELYRIIRNNRLSAALIDA